MSDTVQIPEDEYIPYGQEWAKEMSKLQKIMIITMLAKKGKECDNLSHQLRLFRRKLSNITLDELLKNTGIILEMFDEHFK